jgi:glycosyltransferase involved in cell wall biosynthesis
MNQIVVTAKEIRRYFDADVLPLRFANSIQDIGRVSFIKLSRMLGLTFSLLRYLRKNPDIVYFTLTPARSAFYRDLVFIFILKLMNCIRVFHLHGKGVSKYAANPLNAFLYKWAFKGAKVIQLSPALYPDIDRFVYRSDCFFLPNGIDIPLNNNNKNEISEVENKVPCILFLSSMHASKGPFVLLESLAILKESGKSFEAIFAGPWASDNRAELFFSMVNEYGLSDSVSYVGPVFDENKSQLLKYADIFVHPTLNDAFPLVLLEAMSYGLPIVATIEGAIPEIVEEGVTGFLVPKQDPLSLTDRLSALLSDRSLCLRFGNEGEKRFLNNYTREIFENTLTQILLQCV